MHRLVSAASCLMLVGCAVVKTTDVTDASFKRHQSVSVFGWPVYARVTDRESGARSSLAVKRDPEPIREFAAPLSPFQQAELLREPVEPDLLSDEGR